MVYRHFWIIALVISAVLCAVPASGSTVARMSLETMADHAGQVITGDVVAVRSYWTGAPRRIESDVSFANVTYLKGALPDSDDGFSLIVPGGTVGNTTMRVEGGPSFTVGESWVLFLLSGYKTYPVVGVSQGAF